MKYRSANSGRLTSEGNPLQGQCLAGSLTGAVASQRVTEARKGKLGLDGNQFLECNGISLPDCKTDRSSSCESRA